MTGTEGLESERTVISSPLNFTALVASAGRLYGRSADGMLLMFALMGVLISLLPAFFFFELPEGTLIPAYLFVQVVIPTVGLSLGMGVAAVAMNADLEGRPMGIRGAWSFVVRERLRECLASALLAAMIALFISVFLGLLGLLIIFLFFGPPVLMQVVALEDERFQTAWPRTKELLKGHWARVLMYLFTIGLAIALVQSGAVAFAAAITEDLGRWARAAIVSLAQVVLLGLTMPYLAAAGFALYKDLVWRAGNKDNLDAGAPPRIDGAEAAPKPERVADRSRDELLGETDRSNEVVP